MIQKGELVVVREDIVWAAQLHGKVGEVMTVWPEGERWCYDVEFPGEEGGILMYGFELDRY